MYCKKCGKENVEDAKFCVGCGEKINTNEPIISDKTTILTQADYKFAQQINIDNQNHMNVGSQTEKFLSKLNRKVIASMIFLISIVILIVALLISFVASSSNDKLKFAKDYDPETSLTGDYVTTDIVKLASLYESGVEIDGNEHIEYYYCIAFNSNGDAFIVQIPCSYYDETLYYLELEEEGELSIASSETVYGSVIKMDTELENKLLEDFSDSENILNLLIDNACVSLYSEPLKEKKDDSGIIIVFFLFVPLALSIHLFAKSKSQQKKANKAVQDYGDIVAVVNNVKSNLLYSDKKISASFDYIISNKEIYNIVSTKDVLCMYQYVHRTNFVVDDVSLIIINKYGEEIKFKYDVKFKDKIADVIIKLYPLCPDSVLGYNSESMNYIAKNKIQRIKN